LQTNEIDLYPPTVKYLPIVDVGRFMHSILERFRGRPKTFPPIHAPNRFRRRRLGLRNPEKSVVKERSLSDDGVLEKVMGTEAPGGHDRSSGRPLFGVMFQTRNRFRVHGWHARTRPVGV